MSEHTSGPWEARIYGGWDAPRIWSGVGSVALLQHHESGPSEAEANARLIAAAPDLLAHLQFAVKLFSGIPALSATAQVEAMRSAIDRATKVQP